MVRALHHAWAMRVGRYVLGELLGYGTLTEAYAGVVVGDHGFAKPVAIKRLRREVADDRAFVARLIEQANIQAGIHHGNVVSVLDLVHDDDDVFVIQDLVDGPSVRQLAEMHRLSPAFVTYIVQAAAAAIEAAHGVGIVHARLDLDDIFVTSSGEVRVADFGLADAGEPGRDVRALGSVLYQLVTGVQLASRRRVIRPSLLDPALPPALDQVCTAEYATARQLIEALGELRFAMGWRDGAPELARLLETAPRTGELTRTADPVTLVTRSLIGAVPMSFTNDTTIIARAVTAPIAPRERHVELAVCSLAALVGMFAAIISS